MAKKDIPELVKFTIDNRNAQNMSASLKDATSDINKFMRTVESAANALTFFQSRIKKIVTDPKDPEYGLIIQEIMVDKKDAATVKDALVAKNASLGHKDPADPTNLLPSPYNIRAVDVPTKVGSMKLHGQDAFKEAQSKIKMAGGDIWREPTKKSPDRVKYYYPYEDINNATSQEKAKKQREIFGEAKKISKDDLAYDNAKKDAAEKRQQEREAKQQEREAKQQEAAEKKAKSMRFSKGLSVVHTIINVLTGIADIARRILVSSLNNAALTKQRTIEANSLGMSYKSSRSASIFDVAHGMEEGVTVGALQSLQDMFGDPTRLDTKALDTLSRVMGEKAEQMVRTSTDGPGLKQLLAEIMESFFNQYKAGKNSLGTYVGKTQSRRELTSVLRSLSPELAEIFSHMLDDYEGGINNNFSSYKEWVSNTQTNRTGQTEIEFERVKEIASLWDKIKSIAMDIKDAWKNNILIKLQDLIKDLSETRIGETPKQTIEHNRKNKKESDKNLGKVRQAINSSNFRAQPRIDELSSVKETPTNVTNFWGTKILSDQEAEQFKYDAELLAGIASGVYDVSYFQEHDLTGKRTGMKTQNKAEIRKYIARAKEIYNNAIFDPEIQDELTVLQVQLKAIKDFEKEVDKADAEKKKYPLFQLTTAEEGVKAQSVLESDVNSAMKNLFGYWAMPKNQQAGIRKAMQESFKDHPEFYTKMKASLTGDKDEAYDQDVLDRLGITPEYQEEVNKALEERKAERLKELQRDNPKLKELPKEEEEKIEKDLVAHYGADFWMKGLTLYADGKKLFPNYVLYIKAFINDTFKENLGKSDTRILNDLIRSNLGLSEGTYQVKSVNENGMYVLKIIDEKGNTYDTAGKEDFGGQNINGTLKVTPDGVFFSK